MCRICDAKLATLYERRHARMFVITDRERVGNGAQQIANEIVELVIGNEMRSLLMPKRSAENARKTHQGLTSAGEAVGLAVDADDFTLHTESGGLQRDKRDVPKSAAVHGVAKHFFVLASFAVQMKVNRSRRGQK